MMRWEHKERTEIVGRENERKGNAERRATQSGEHREKRLREKERREEDKRKLRSFSRSA